MRHARRGRDLELRRRAQTAGISAIISHMQPTNRQDSAADIRSKAQLAVAAGEEALAHQLWESAPTDSECALRLRERAILARDSEEARRWLAASACASPGEAKVAAGLAEMLAGRVEQALRYFEAALQLEPALPSAVHHRARALFNLGSQEAALGALQTLITGSPDYLEARCSLAHVLRAQGRFDEAVSQFQAAARAAPGLYPAQFNLGITELLRERPEAALACFNRCLQLRSDDPQAWLNRGLSLHMSGAPSDALACYQRVIALCPDSATGHYYLGSLFNELLRSGEAETHLREAMRLAPDDPDIAAEWIGLMEQLSKLDVVRQALPGALAKAPDHPRLLLEAAKLARRDGQMDQARRALAQIPAQRLLPRDAQVYWFERGLLHDRTSEPDQALAALAQAHRFAERSPRRKLVDREGLGRRLAHIEQWLDENGAMLRRGFDEPLPPLPFSLVFLVGLPRSGTTLLDTVLDAQPGVASIEEKPTLESLLDCSGARYLDGLLDLDAPALARLRSQYVDLAARWTADATPRVLVDKMPLRFLDAAALRWLFPEAKILFVARHPYDVMLSNYMQQYVPTEAFVHFDTPEAAARTCRSLLAVWRRMRETFQLPHHQLRYEDLVTDPAAALASLGDFLGISIDEQSLDPATRLAGRGRVATSSYQQVAEPLYQRAVNRWHAYREQLAGPFSMLEDEARQLGYGDLHAVD